MRSSAIALVVAALALPGCGGSDEEGVAGETTTAPPVLETTTATTTDTQPHETTPTVPPPAMAARSGAQIYRDLGCDGCHGAKAQGTTIAPPLPGHSIKQVRRQVRVAGGAMPSYPPAQLSDAELKVLASYIAGLPEPSRHVEPVKMADFLAAHHRLAIGAIVAGDPRDALHHVVHIVEVVKGKHRAAMLDVQRLLRQKRYHDAQHLIEEMLAGSATVGLTPKRLHLEMALAAVSADDWGEARHQVNHFLALAKGEQKRAGQEILDAIKRKHRHETIDGLRDLLGLAHE